MQRILVGVDASERAPGVLQRAISFARGTDARLFILRAVRVPIEFPIEALSMVPASLPSQLIAITQTGLDRFVQDVPPALLERAEARIGTPWQVLCDTALEINADLVIIGSHGYGMIDRLLGTTAARVVNHAPCSVLVVRDAEPKK